MTKPPSIPIGPRQEAPTTYKPHPGNEHLVGCPNCRSADHIVIDVPSVTHHQVRAYAIDGVTTPEFDIEATTVPSPDEPVRDITKVRCVACRWAYTGTDPLGKLVPADETAGP